MSITNKKKSRINIKYIANVAGVSPSTISRAIRNDPTAKKETKERILKLVEELNYFPNLIAKGLRDKRTKTIGIILNDFTNPYYYETIKNIEGILSNSNYAMILCDSNCSLELERKNIITMLSKGADGIIISPVNANSENIKLINENDLNVVYIDVSPNLINTNYVLIDHEKAAYIATEYLIKKGHRNIILINGPNQLTSSKKFLKGYLRAFKNNNYPINRKLIKFVDLSIESGFELIKKIYTNKNGINLKDFTGIVCFSDLLAVGVYEASKTLGFNIPDDYSIVGNDNILMTSYLNPPLTTIHAPKKRIGKLSAQILLENLEKGSNELKKIIVEPKLIERNSVKQNLINF